LHLTLGTLRVGPGAAAVKIPKIGWLGVRAAGPGGGYELLRRELRALGYVDSKNIAFEYRSGENKIDRLPALADELVRVKVDVLLAAATTEAVAAKKATRTIPIVFFSAADPVALGLVDSLARPGGNITGFTNSSSVLAGKRLELLKEIIPNLSRVAVLWNPADPAAALQWKESQLAARELGLQVHSTEVSSVDRFESAFKEAIQAGSAALTLTANHLSVSNQKTIAEFAAKNRMPVIYNRGGEDFLASGGLMSYGYDRNEPYKRAAVYVDKILKGTKPADLPVEQPTKFELMINLKAAKQIGFTIPPNVLARADNVIK
jgi:putative ABC transport system substrate-binding protein